MHAGRRRASLVSVACCCVSLLYMLTYKHARKHATSAAAELGGEIHNVSRNRARAQVLPRAQKLHVYGSGTFGAFWWHTPIQKDSELKGC